ncbi:MAG: ROK family protein, partial [bacterium]|nr:ROK family protein [bacterium]
MAKKCYLGIDWGGSKIAFALVDENDNIVRSNSKEIAGSGAYQQTLNLISDQIDQVNSFVIDTDMTLSGVGCAVAAQVRVADGFIIGSPNIGIADVPLANDLSQKAGLPVIVENDVNAAAFGEYGANPDDGDPFMAVFVGTGVGGGLVVNGEIYYGADGSAGEIGHIPVQPLGAVCGCGARGCVEAYTGGAAIEKRAKAALEFGRAGVLQELGYAGDMPNPAEIAGAAEAGDGDCTAIIAEAEYALAAGLAAAINLLNPATV